MPEEILCMLIFVTFGQLWKSKARLDSLVKFCRPRVSISIPSSVILVQL